MTEGARTTQNAGQIDQVTVVDTEFPPDADAVAVELTVPGEVLLSATVKFSWLVEPYAGKDPVHVKTNSRVPPPLDVEV
ncbi:hypothetical protein GCM10023153_26620 [Ornithinibacter aureus]|uniref:Uncharacterized protein n=1 Tax=Ornithinibacter aureus TaxID=622664 RepID=A0ABP8K382_9MICO